MPDRRHTLSVLFREDSTLTPTWQRKTSRRSGRNARFSTLSRTGVSARTSAGVYNTDEPTRDQRALPLLPDPPPLLRPPHYDKAEQPLGQADDLVSSDVIALWSLPVLLRIGFPIQHNIVNVDKSVDAEEVRSICQVLARVR